MKILLGNEEILRSFKQKNKTSRYFNIKVTEIMNDTDIQQSLTKKGLKSTEDFIVITDSGIKWGDERIDKDLVDKTAHFNDYLNKNPYDVDMWLQFVKFQVCYLLVLMLVLLKYSNLIFLFRKIVWLLMFSIIVLRVRRQQKIFVILNNCQYWTVL